MPVVAYPRMLLPSRWSASFLVGRRPEGRPDDLASYRPTMFQGMPAFERVTKDPGVFLDRPPLFTYGLVFARGDAWYEMVYHVTHDRDSVPPMMMRYFNTFQHTREGR
jgi:hypothetical protein